MSDSTYDLEQVILAIDGSYVGTLGALGVIIANQTNGTQKVQVTNFPSPGPISGTVIADQGTAGSAPWPVNVENFPVTQPISGTVTALQGTSPWVTSLASTTITGTVGVTQSTSPWIVSGTITTSPNVNVHDGSGNSIGSTSGSLNVDVTNTVPVTGTFFQATQPVSESNVDKNFGTWAYYAGTSGTVAVTAGQRVTAITCHCTTAGSLTINSGSTITVPANTAFSDNPLGNLTAPTIVFTGTDTYFVEVVS